MNFLQIIQIFYNTKNKWKPLLTARVMRDYWLLPLTVGDPQHCDRVDPSLVDIPANCMSSKINTLDNTSDPRRSGPL